MTEYLLKFLLSYYLTVNIFLFILIGIDKLKAKKGAWRIPEITLITLSVLGGGAGGFLGMEIFRHKTKKTYFRVIFLLSILAHLFIIYRLF